MSADTDEYHFDPGAVELPDPDDDEAEPPRSRAVARAEAGPGMDREPELRASMPARHFEPADEFLARLELKNDPEWVVEDLIPHDGIAVWHGRPRSMKSLAALELNLSAAIDVPAFGSERFKTDVRGGSVLYLTEEDGERLIASRLRLMLAGHDLENAPKRLHILSRPGWNLERPDDQAAVLDAIGATSPAPTLLTIDPARGSMPSLDKGPSDAAGPIRFLRQLLRETPIRAVLLLHHDVKPDAKGKDERSRAEKASGGAVFSIADCPVNFERVDDRSCFAVPCAFKVGADPQPFRIVFESGTPSGEQFRGFLRARTTTTDERTEDRTRTVDAVAQVLDEADGWLPTGAILDAVKGRKQEILAALRKLAEDGQATERAAGRGREWRKGLGA